MNESSAGRSPSRYVAVGDSFTEGVGDDLADGSVRGWADLVAGVLSEGWLRQDPAGLRTGYANLAIRGKLLGAIIDEQLDAALDLQPDLVTFAGGGNDMLRPRADLPSLLRLIDLSVARLTDSGAQVVIFTGADPCDGLPFGARIRATGDRLATGVRKIADRRGALLVDMWPLDELRDPRYWAADRLHLNSIGHEQVAARVLDALEMDRPAEWSAPVGTPAPRPRTARDELDFYWEYVGPWVRRRLTGTSSGDRRPPKRPAATGGHRRGHSVVQSASKSTTAAVRRAVVRSPGPTDRRVGPPRTVGQASPVLTDRFFHWAQE